MIQVITALGFIGLALWAYCQWIKPRQMTYCTMCWYNEHQECSGGDCECCDGNNKKGE